MGYARIRKIRKKSDVSNDLESGNTILGQNRMIGLKIYIFTMRNTLTEHFTVEITVLLKIARYSTVDRALASLTLM